jgi:hypothetical protein
MSNSCSLRILGPLSLSLSHRSHEAVQRIAHCLLHRVFGAAIECEPVDNRPDDDAFLHELLDRLNNVIVVTAQPIDPANNERVPSSEKVKQSLALFTLFQPCRDTAVEKGA